jgi:hypothetical protein
MEWRRKWILMAALVLLLSGLACNFPFRGVQRYATSTPNPAFTDTPTFQFPLPGQTFLPETPTFTPSSRATFSGPPPSGQIVLTCGFDRYDQICLMNADGSNYIRLTHTSATDFYASISPDATEIVFSSQREGSFNIYRMDMDGASLTRLTEGLGSTYAPEVSSRDGTIVFTVENSKGQNIWIMDRDGSHPAALTASQGDNGDPTCPPGDQPARYGRAQQLVAGWKAPGLLCRATQRP